MLSPQERTALALAVEAAPERGRLAARRGPSDRRPRRPARRARHQGTRGATGTRWTSAQGQLQIETFRIDTGATLEPCSSSRRSAAAAASSYNVLRPTVLRHLGHAGPEEIRTCAAMRETARCAASPSSTTRRWKAPWTRWWRRCRARSCRSRSRLSVAGAAGPSRRKVEYGTGVVVAATGHVSPTGS